MAEGDASSILDDYCWCRSLAVIVGVVWLAALLIQGVGQLINGLRAYVLSPWFGLGTLDLTKCGAWAVVTGASEGIGEAYALELAKRGLNVVLISNDTEALQRVARKILKDYGRDVLVISADFSIGSCDTYKRISMQLQDLDIGILVNNVGMVYEKNSSLGNMPLTRLHDMIKVNCHPVVQMTHLVLPRMMKKKKGVVINLCSITSIMAIAFLTVYSASKVYVRYISDGLRKEYGKYGIVVQNVMPFYVSTKMTKFKPVSMFVPSPQTFVRSALYTVGIQDNTNGYFPHALLGFICTWTPHFILTKSMTVKERT